MLTLGSSPNALRHPQKSFVVVASSQWTSSPTTISHSLMTPDSGAPSSITRPTRNMRASPMAGANTWTPIGRPSSPVPKGTDSAG